MYLGDISKVLLIRDNVNVITNTKYSHLIGSWLQIRDQIMC